MGREHASCCGFPPMKHCAPPLGAVFIPSLFPHRMPLHQKGVGALSGTRECFVPGVLVVGRESGRVGGLGDLGASDLLQRVDALAFGIESVHEMHDWMGCFVGGGDVGLGRCWLLVDGWVRPSIEFVQIFDNSRVALLCGAAASGVLALLFPEPGLLNCTVQH